MRFGGSLLLLAVVSARAEAATNKETPVLRGSSSQVAASAGHDLLVFKGSMLLNEFVYRAVVSLPPEAAANTQTARLVATEVAAFLREAGYELAKVRAQVKGDQIEVEIDEGALDKIIFVGAGWITALRFRATLNLPLDVFNRRLFEAQMPKLQKKFGLSNYTFELWPVHLIDDDNAGTLDQVEELRAMPMIRPARGYELRIFTKGEAWGTGFSPEILLGGSIGYGAGGRYRWKDLIQDGDRWQMHFRVGGAFRSHLDGSGSYPVNSNDYVTARWLSRSWDGTASGLRMTIAPHAEIWTLQRGDAMLHVEQYKIGTAELGTGAGSQMTPEFSLYFTLGLQRRWIFDVQNAGNPLNLPPTLSPYPLAADVAKVPTVSNRAFLRMNSGYIFNPDELRQDLRNGATLQLDAFRPVSGDRGFFRFDVQGHQLFFLGWHEVRLGGHISGEAGDVWFVDEIPLESHLRIGFGLQKFTQRAGSLSFEFRYSLLRDKMKIGVFTDAGIWQHLPRDDPKMSPELAGSTGLGAFFFVFDELQIDAFYGVGWATDGSPSRMGLALAIKEAF
ncbi:MAG: hypothetical protein ABR567_01025 [Myxococcales bacterium]|nr:hypothetical protein [Myxococcales bacterium]